MSHASKFPQLGKSRRPNNKKFKIRIKPLPFLKGSPEGSQRQQWQTEHGLHWLAQAEWQTWTGKRDRTPGFELMSRSISCQSQQPHMNLSMFFISSS